MSANGPHGYEPMPPVNPEESKPPPVPKEVRISFWVWLLSAAMGFVAGAMIAVDKQGFVDDFLKSGAASGLPADELRRAADIGFWALLVGIFGFGLLYILFVFKMRAGRNWARIVLAVLAVLGLMSQAAATGTSDLLAMVSVLVSIVGLVFMFMPSSNAYFNQFKRRR